MNFKNRRIVPALEDLEDLPTPLTAGEGLVLAQLDKYLSPEWEIYIQPHLNGLRPDFVVLNPKRGVTVIEVKDSPLAAIDKYSRAKFKSSVHQAANYKDEIETIYCPRLQSRGSMKSFPVRACLVFSQTPIADLGKFVNAKPGGDYIQHGAVRLAGHEALLEDHGELGLPSLLGDFDEDIADESLAVDLRHWLVEPDFSIEQREPLILSGRQLSLIQQRTESGYRRIKGPAGSGKSLVLAARAAELAASGKSVLVIAFNITLLNYLRDLCARWCSDKGKRTAFVNQIVWLHYHHWCKRLCLDNDLKSDYNELWGEMDSESRHSANNPILREGLPRLALRAIELGTQTYDAILVDEGQDIHPLWWETLRHVLKPGGEMMLCSDSTQDLYECAANWTDDSMKKAGFKGRWLSLDTSYRLPQEIVDLARDFAIRYFGDEAVNLPVAEQRQLTGLYPCKIHRSETTYSNLVEEAIRQLPSLILQNPSDTQLAMADVTFLVDSNNIGKQLVLRLEKLGIRTTQSFGRFVKGKIVDDWSNTRRQKMCFYKGAATVKVTTIQCFKGWESTAVILLLSRPGDRRTYFGIYTAITRVRRSITGSQLSIVRTSQAPSL
jgi:hypothetical protein